MKKPPIQAKTAIFEKGTINGAGHEEARFAAFAKLALWPLREMHFAFDPDKVERQMQVSRKGRQGLSAKDAKLVHWLVSHWSVMIK